MLHIEYFFADSDANAIVELPRNSLINALSSLLHGNRKIVTFLWMFVYCLTLSPVFPSKFFFISILKIYAQFFWIIPLKSVLCCIESSPMPIGLITPLYKSSVPVQNANTPSNVFCLQWPFPGTNPFLMLFF